MIELTQCWLEGASLLHPTTSPKHTRFSLGPLPPEGALPGLLYPTVVYVLHWSGYPEPWAPSTAASARWAGSVPASDPQ